MLDIFTKRTSCRSYLPKEIELEKINQLKQAINASPTACNFQDFSCIFITDKDMIDKLCLYSNNQSHVKQIPLFIAFYADQNRPNSTIKWAPADAIIAATTAMYTAESLGLQTCLIGNVLEHEQEVNKMLNIQGDMKLVVGLCVGYAKQKTPPRTKLNRCYDGQYDIVKTKRGE